MVKLCDILDIDLLKQHLANGVVRRQVHPDYPELFIFNYTEQAQFDRIWDNVTNVCRGLICMTDIVIARGFNKFHNLNTDYVPETMEENLPKVKPTVTQKLDGSMGLLYHWDSQVWVATRGSFSSEQARWATEWLRARRTPELDCLLTVGNDHTLVTEIIYPENRIVVDYDFAGLVLTGIIKIATGEEAPRSVLEQVGQQTGIAVVKAFDKSLAECAGEDNPNEEGYVLSYEREGTYPLKVKVKFAEYCRLHRILTGLNPKAIWEMLVPPEMLVQQQPPEGIDPTLAEKRRASVESILNDPKMPAGFIQWFTGWVTHLRNEYAKMEAEAKEVFNNRPWRAPWASEPSPQALSMVRKEHALYFQKTPRLASILFAMLDGKDYEPIIWKHLKPRGDAETYKRDGE